MFKTAWCLHPFANGQVATPKVVDLRANRHDNPEFTGPAPVSVRIRRGPHTLALRQWDTKVACPNGIDEQKKKTR